MIVDKNKKNKKHILIKWPWMRDDFFKDNYKEYIKIFIIRNPYYVFSSLNKRFNYRPNNKHSIEEYIKTAEIFLKNYKKGHQNIFCIKYEDIFANNYQNVKNILNKLKIDFTNDIFCNVDRDNKIVKNIIYKDIPDIPKNTDHAKYRTWQINQRFENFNDKSKLNLLDEQIKKLSTSGIIKKLNYKIE